jgi:hypothetical protein
VFDYVVFVANILVVGVYVLGAATGGTPGEHVRFGNLIDRAWAVPGHASCLVPSPALVWTAGRTPCAPYGLWHTLQMNCR